MLESDPYAENPNRAWRKRVRKEIVKSVNPSSLFIEDDRKLRVVCISDTHGKHNKIDLPEGDILIHAGDFTGTGTRKQVECFNEWLEEIKDDFKHIIVIAGNHEKGLDPETNVSEHFKGKDLVTNCTFLEHEEVNIEGYKFFGSPYTPKFYDWAFMQDRVDIIHKWNEIPTDVDILITHGPPIGYLDLAGFKLNERTGCVNLLNVVKSIKPKFHVFGHIHESYGIMTNDSTVFINASICNILYQPLNKPIVFDLPLRM